MFGSNTRKVFSRFFTTTTKIAVLETLQIIRKYCNLED
jgi:hypothetical protein